MNVTSRESTSAPVTAASEIFAAASTAVMCWRRRPGFGRFARMLKIRNGRPVMAERASDVRRICPPPSPNEPSMGMRSGMALRGRKDNRCGAFAGIRDFARGSDGRAAGCRPESDFRRMQ
jgi:hypothetical protein